MDDYENLEKLAKLKDKDIINEDEYFLLKQNIISKYNGKDIESKSGIAYALLAWFLGIFGAHNFYAGYTKRAIVQLLMTLFSWMLLFIPLIVVQIWALADMCLINKDAAGRPFSGDKILIMIIRITAVAFYVLGYLFGFFGFYWTFFAQNGASAAIASAPLPMPMPHGTIIYH